MENHYRLHKVGKVWAAILLFTSVGLLTGVSTNTVHAADTPGTSVPQPETHVVKVRYVNRLSNSKLVDEHNFTVETTETSIDITKNIPAGYVLSDGTPKTVPADQSEQTVSIEPKETTISFREANTGKILPNPSHWKVAPGEFTTLGANYLPQGWSYSSERAVNTKKVVFNGEDQVVDIYPVNNTPDDGPTTVVTFTDAAGDTFPTVTIPYSHPVDEEGYTDIEEYVPAGYVISPDLPKAYKLTGAPISVNVVAAKKYTFHYYYQDPKTGTKYDFGTSSTLAPVGSVFTKKSSVGAVFLGKWQIDPNELKDPQTYVNNGQTIDVKMYHPGDAVITGTYNFVDENGISRGKAPISALADYDLSDTELEPHVPTGYELVDHVVPVKPGETKVRIKKTTPDVPPYVPPYHPTVSTTLTLVDADGNVIKTVTLTGEQGDAIADLNSQIPAGYELVPASSNPTYQSGTQTLVLRKKQTPADQKTQFITNGNGSAAVYVQNSKAPQYTYDAAADTFTEDDSLPALPMSSGWLAPKKAVVKDGETYYLVGAHSYLRASDVTTSKVAKETGVVTITAAGGASTYAAADQTGKAVQTLAPGTAWKYFAVATNADGSHAYLVADNQWVSANAATERPAAATGQFKIGRDAALTFTGNGVVVRGRVLRPGTAWRVTGVKTSNGKTYYRVATDLYVRSDYGAYRK
ncbi:KxYKxGKxW signal peptide domain-containing protein [Schleiferilactobacillus shenzhenensis]|uniref:S-layer protein C-terminal domain-containing protein n=1 Tax=Schleiferilactobacillus shenzhenensis LY-73 TaxID=1231336 RepID=U4TRM8_9LACO|nr:KxYKxGKxW signal peptide domain-containing protein [Schleiferilactobacillus shenzhenensis]ERL64558.1 hypothetical protein L248_0853 [Schleiferilactobacillus shenzhenensis LY-73]